MFSSTERHQLGDIFLGGVVLLLLSSPLSSGVESDIDCLKSIHKSLEDPLNSLTSTWNYNNESEGFICNFLGIECWHPHESKVLNIKLSDLGLKGQFPRGVMNCTSLTGLDLSSNNLSGSIPDDIHKLIPFITSLDLSSNKFSEPIPKNLSNCTFLNFLKLDNNQLSGQIPAELSLLSRIETFSAANNLLTGPVPNFGGKNSTITADSYANNPGLCGFPLDDCRSAAKKSIDMMKVVKSNGVVMMVGAGFGIGFACSFSYFIFQ